MRKMKDSGIEWIGEIPEDWECFYLSQIFSQVKNKNIGIQETNLLSLSYGKIIRKNIETTFGLLPENFEGYNIIERDNIVLRLTDLQNDHKSLRVGLVTEKGIITSAYLTLKNKTNMSSNYFYYLLHSFDIAKGFYGMGAGVRQGLNWNEIRSLRIISPKNVPEQQRIADFLDDKVSQIDSVISKTRETIEEYKKLKQSIITEVVTGKVKIENGKVKESEMLDVKGNKLPNDWKWMKLKYLVTENLQYGANEAGVDFSSDLPRYIRITDIDSNGKLKNENKLSLTEEIARNFILDEGDILFARSGASVGKTFIYKSEYARAGFAGYLIRAKLNKSIINPQFFFYFTNSSFYEIWKNGIFIQSTIQNIGADKYSELQVPVPPLTSQLSLITFLDQKCSEIDALITKKEQLVVELESYKKSLIYEVVTGKRSV